MHSYSAFMLGVEHDDAASIGAPPSKRFLICAEPRTGSNLLCDYMFQLGWGVPMEYFEDFVLMNLCRRWQTTMGAPYVDALVRRRTRNDIFGAKVLYPFEWARAWPHVWANVAIKLVREDDEAQARSFAVMSKTNYPCDVGDPDDRPPVYEPTEDEMAQSREALTKIRAFWNRELPKADVFLTYEALVHKPEECLKAVAEALQEPYDGTVPEPRIFRLPRPERETE